MKSKRGSPPHQQTMRSSSHGNLTDEQNMDFLYRNGEHPNGKLIKRTKSFWKFGKSDDEILEGMALWQHRDLVQTDTEKTLDRKREATLKRLRKRSTENNTISSTNSSETLVNGQNDMHNDLRDLDDAMPINNNTNYPMTKSDIDQRISMQHDENIYGQTDYQKVRSAPPNMVSRAKLVRQSYIEMDLENQEQQQRLKQQQQQWEREQQREQQKQLQREPQPRSRTTNRTKSTANNNSKSMIQPHKTIEYYDTSEADNTLKKQRKHTYSNQVPPDTDQSPVRIHANSMRRSGGGGGVGDEPNYFDDDSVNDHIIMKTVKRQEILKQYYSSGTDTERNSASSSDPYDCIVVDDHLVRRENEKNKNKSANPKMEFKTFRSNATDKMVVETIDTLPRAGTLLPRTKLTKSSNTMNGIHQHSNGCVSDGGIATVKRSMEKRERRNGRPTNTNAPDTNSNQNTSHNNNGEFSDRITVERRHNNDSRPTNNESNNINRHSANSDSTNKSYGPWYDLWGDDAPVRMNMT